MLNGFINLYKNKGISSNKALSILKKHLRYNNVTEKVGHFGTLDPLAEGVLPVAIGRATRLFDYMQDKIKVYKAEFTFGIETDTLDSEGEVIGKSDKIITEEEILKVIPSLIGEIEQYPPKYSAKNVNGQRAYDLARKGKEFTLEAKKVYIKSIELLEKCQENTFSFRIYCGGGTYIRSIAKDMAELLGTVGIMSALIREQSGIFTIYNSVQIDENPINISDIIIPMETAAQNMEKISLETVDIKWLKDGKKLSTDLDDGLYAVFSDECFCALASVNGRVMEVKTWLM